MDKIDTPVKSINKKPLIGLLTRRSTKIEPQNDTTTTTTGSNITGRSNQFSIDQRKPLSSLKSNKSSQICDNILNEPSTSSKTNPFTSTTQFQTRNSNKFSGQFSLCCRVEDNISSSSPINKNVKFSKSVDYEKMKFRKQNLKLDLDKIDLITSNDYECYESSPKSPSSSINGCLSRPLEIAGASSSLNNDITDSPKQSKSHFVKRQDANTTKPVFNEYQPSIAITACRSRFRQKFLPPVDGSGDGYILNSNQEQKHASSPNITQNTPEIRRESSTDNRKSISFDTIIHNGDVKVNRPASTDSLARHALMAAHVLNLIPADKARDRNYLCGRLAVNSLLGTAELTKLLPTKEVTIFLGTWNMNGQHPPKQMNDFVLPNGIEHVPDIIVIGTQESCSERFEWEVTLQETLGPTHILLHSVTLGTLHLGVFIRRDLIWFCSVPEDASLSVRPGTAFRTKGAVAISFCLFGTSMLFVTSHLTAHQQKVKERVQDVRRIINSLDLPRNLPLKNRNKDVTQNFDSVFWCGDLNFRLSEPRDNLLKWIESTKFPLPAHLPHGYLHTDQLTSVLSEGAAFKGFKEAHITFPPTYKYDPGTQQFDTSSKQRAPAYTDRILYKYKPAPTSLRRGSAAFFPPAPVKCVAYDSVQSITTSDHKPVWALFKNTIRPGVDSIPLAAGLFNREVYLEGMRRRLDNNETGASTVCSIQ